MAHHTLLSNAREERLHHTHKECLGMNLERYVFYIGKNMLDFLYEKVAKLSSGKSNLSADDLVQDCLISRIKKNLGR